MSKEMTIRKVYFFNLLGDLDGFIISKQHGVVVTKVDEYNAIIYIDNDYHNIHYYVNRMNGNRYWLHRSGGLPARINHNTGEVHFFENGFNKEIEELSVDDEMKVFLKLKYSLQYDGVMSTFHHIYK